MIAVMGEMKNPLMKGGDYMNAEIFAAVCAVEVSEDVVSIDTTASWVLGIDVDFVSTPPIE